MIIKDITAEQISTTGTILPFKKNIFPNKINKTIEIVIVPKLVDITANQKNVGIVLDEKLILKILNILEYLYFIKYGPGHRVIVLAAIVLVGEFFKFFTCFNKI